MRPRWFDTALADVSARGSALAAALSAALPGDVRARALAVLVPTDAQLIGAIVSQRQEPDDLVCELLTHSIPEIRAAAAIQFRGEHGRHDLPSGWEDVWQAAIMSAAPKGYGEYELMLALEELARAAPEKAEAWYAKHLAAGEGASAWSVFGTDLLRPLANLPLPNRLTLLRGSKGQWWLGDFFNTMAAGNPEFVAAAIDSNVMTVHQARHALEDLSGSAFERLATVLVERGADPQIVASTLDRGYIGSEANHYAELVAYCETLADSGSAALSAVGEAGLKMFRRDEANARAAEHHARVVGII